MYNEENYNEYIRVFNTYCDTDLKDIKNEYDRELAKKVLRMIRCDSNE